MEIENQIKFQFKGFSIIDLNFVSKRPFNKKDELHSEIDPKVFYPDKRNDQFKIILDVKRNSQDCFYLSLIAVGDFIFNQDVIDRQTRKRFVNVNSVAIMSPYLRSFITTFTANIGRVVPTIIIPTKQFKGDIEEISEAPNNSSSISDAE